MSRGGGGALKQNFVCFLVKIVKKNRKNQQKTCNFWGSGGGGGGDLGSALVQHLPY